MPSRLTPMEIESQQFRIRMRGLDSEQVRMYLHSVAEEIERLRLENAELHERTGRLQGQVDEYGEREKALQKTLVIAQKVTEDMKETARAEAQLILKDARLKADYLLQESQDQLTRLELELSRRRLECDLFAKRIRLTIEEHLALLDERAEPETKEEKSKKSKDVDNLRVLPHRTGSAAG